VDARARRLTLLDTRHAGHYREQGKVTEPYDPKIACGIGIAWRDRPVFGFAQPGNLLD
jgi:hypothetical protein